MCSSDLSKAGGAPLCRGCRARWLFSQTNNTCFLPPPREGLSSSVGAGAGAPSKANVSQSVGAAAQRRSARSSRHRVERQRGPWRSHSTSLVHRRDAQPFHQADSQRAAPFACRLCQTLGVTRNISVNLMHRAVALRPSRPGRCLSALVVSQARASRALRSRAARL